MARKSRKKISRNKKFTKKGGSSSKIVGSTSEAASSRSGSVFTSRLPARGRLGPQKTRIQQKKSAAASQNVSSSESHMKYKRPTTPGLIRHGARGPDEVMYFNQIGNLARRHNFNKDYLYQLFYNNQVRNIIQFNNFFGGRLRDLKLKKLNKLNEYLVLAGGEYLNDYLNGKNERTNKKKLKNKFENDLKDLKKTQKELNRQLSVRGINNSGITENPLYNPDLSNISE